MPKHNINDFNQLYRRNITKIGDGSTLIPLQLNRIDPKTLRNLTHVTVENQTNAYTKCQLGINSSGLIYYLDELLTIAAAELAVSRSDILLGEGDVFFAELTGTTSGDLLVMNCIGWELYL
ncbi:hypothetical protein ES705_16854 [subsurface metagenome]